MLLAFLATVVLIHCTSPVTALPNGAPVGACSTRTPSHSVAAMAGAGGYFIHSDLIDNGGSYTGGATYTLTLSGGNSFRGFLIQARNSADNAFLGSFTITDSSAMKALTCSGNSVATVTHTSNSDKTSVSVDWTAPSGTGTVKFYYAVVRVRDMFYANIDASLHRPPVPMSSPLAMPTPTPTPTAPPCPSTDKSATSNFALVFKQPSGCSRGDCDIYVAMSPNTVNNEFLDVYLEGTASGWVAVGFSNTQTMENTDVVGCKLDSGSMVSVVDTWNPSPRTTPNVRDNTQEGVCSHDTSFTNGRLSCLFSKYGPSLNDGQDLTLSDGTSRYIIYGRRQQSNSNAPNLLYHVDGAPQSTSTKYDPFSDSNSATQAPSQCPPAPASDAVYPLTHGNQSDDYYFAARLNDVNDGFIDIVLEGDAEGWVAVGFSEDQRMAQSDVLACKREESGDTVNVLDTWNPGQPGQYLFNQIDDNQNGVCPHSTEYTDGRIRCSFSRSIAALNDGQDFNLSSTLYRIHQASSSRRGSAGSGLLKHVNTPVVNSRAASVVDEIRNGSVPTGIIIPRGELSLVHAMLMLFAWPILATLAIFFASWMKPALPNGEWFQTHRALMIISLFTTAAGLVIIFVANAQNSAGPAPGLINLFDPKRMAHFVIGICVFALQIANPLIAICRCKPKSSKRWIFNIFHATIIGYMALLLAYVNAGIGLSFYTSWRNLHFWLYIACIGVLLIIEAILHILFTTCALLAKPEHKKELMPSLCKCCVSEKNEKLDLMEMTAASIKPEEEEKKERKQASKDTPFRWAAVALLFLTMLLIVAVMVVLVLTFLAVF